MKFYRTFREEASEAPAEGSQPVVTDGGEPTPAEVTYADGQFKSVSDLEKGYTELRSSYSKKLGAFDGAPEQYTRPESIDENNALFNYASEWGKENQLSDKGLSSFVEGFTEHITKVEQEQMQAYQAEQIKELGDDAKQRIDNVVDFLKANTDITDESLGQLNDMFFGADGIKVLEQVIAKTKQPTPTATPVATAPDTETIKAMRFAKDEFGNRKMSTDPAYRAKVEALERQVVEAR